MGFVSQNARDSTAKCGSNVKVETVGTPEGQYPWNFERLHKGLLGLCIRIHASIHAMMYTLNQDA